MKTILITLIFFFIISFSCDNKNESIAKDVLLGTWKLDSIYIKSENEVKQYPDSLAQEIHVEFTNSSEVVLSGYCNKGSGIYTLNENVISFENVNLTEMACPFVGGEWEVYLYELSKMDSYNITNSKLKLFSAVDIDLFLSEVVYPK